jgi:hypothetical protein
MKASFPEFAGERLQQELQAINEEVRRRLQAVKLSDLLGPPVAVRT